MGYKVKIYPESAENTPKTFPKGSLEENLWRNFDTAKHILEARFLKDYDIIIFDRGAFDRIFWLYLDTVYNTEIALKSAPIAKIFEEYPPDFLVTFYVSENEAIKRRGGEGRLVTTQFISNYNRLLENFIASLKVNKVIVRTDNKKIEEVVQITQNSILEKLESHS